MCTFTAITVQSASDPAEKKIRLSFNRDELKKRPPSKQPSIFSHENSEYIMPVDTQSGGTWIGVNSSFLFFALLNVNEENAESAERAARIKEKRSRGILIPSLLVCKNSLEVREKLKKISFAEFPGFRLICLDAAEMTLENIYWNGKDLKTESGSWDGTPLFYTSSGLGDARVHGPRMKLFQEYFQGYDGTERYEAVQDAFHLQGRENKKGTTVLMEREEAKTVSRSTIELTGSGIKFMYYAPPELEIPVTLEMEPSIA